MPSVTPRRTGTPSSPTNSRPRPDAHAHRHPDAHARTHRHPDATPTPTVTPAPTPTVSVVKPVFGAVMATPKKPTAGEPFAYTVIVTRSDTGKPLMTGTMTCTPTVAGKAVKYRESFKAGKARVTLTVPPTAAGKVLKIKITIRTGRQMATKGSTFTVI